MTSADSKMVARLLLSLLSLSAGCLACSQDEQRSLSTRFNSCLVNLASVLRSDDPCTEVQNVAFSCDMLVVEGSGCLTEEQKKEMRFVNKFRVVGALKGLRLDKALADTCPYVAELLAETAEEGSKARTKLCKPDRLRKVRDQVEACALDQSKLLSSRLARALRTGDRDGAVKSAVCDYKNTWMNRCLTGMTECLDPGQMLLLLKQSGLALDATIVQIHGFDPEECAQVDSEVDNEINH